MTPPSPPPGPPSPGSGLPLVDADAAEQALGDEMDDIVPTHGFHRLPLVGLGGSAGSLGALSRFFEAVDRHVAFLNKKAGHIEEYLQQK